MPVLQGTTSGSIAGIPYGVPSKIISYTLTNKTGGSINVTVNISSHTTTQNIVIGQYAIAANTTEFNDIPVIMLGSYTILLVASGSVDYYFNLENI